jgi:glucuronoarabinoxylan endo-1,4-beta-xylanase
VCSQVPAGSYTNASQLSGSFKMLYDADNLYVLVQVADDRTDHSNDSTTSLFMNDAVEIYVDAGNTKATTYQYNDFHYTFSLVHGTTPMMSETHNNTNGVLMGWVETGTNANYVMEVAIPWSLVGQWTLTPGTLLGFDVQIDHAYKGGVNRDFDLFWHGTNDTDYQNPTQFGVAILKSGAAADLDIFGGLRNSGTINGAGRLAVESGGQLSGTGVINNGNGTLAQSGAGLLPGSAGVAGTLTFGSTLIFDTNAMPTFDLSGNAGSGNDRVILTGGTLAGNGAVVTINPLATLAVANYVLFDVQGAGSVSSDFNTTPAWSGTPPVNAADYSIITSGKQVLLHNVAAPLQPTFNPPIISGGNLILTGSGGTPNNTYSVVTSTDATRRLSSWTPVAGQSGYFGAGGSFSNAIPVAGPGSTRFYSIRSP